MKHFTQALLRRVGSCFLAGVFALLPLVITVAIIIWVTGFLAQFLGPGTLIGDAIRNLGLRFGSDEALAYVVGTLVVLAAVFLVGVLVQAGAKNVLQRLTHAILRRIPIVGSIYGTSQQLVALLDKKDPNQMSGMSVVFCLFGKESGTGFLALLVSPECFRIRDRDYQIVIVPTAPVPIGGGLLFVPTEAIQPANMSVDGLMSIYVSMGITAPQFLPGHVNAKI